MCTSTSAFTSPSLSTSMSTNGALTSTSGDIPVTAVCNEDKDNDVWNVPECCPVCLSTVCSRVYTSCGHHFCGECVDDFVARTPLSCCLYCGVGGGRFLHVPSSSVDTSTQDYKKTGTKTVATAGETRDSDKEVGRIDTDICHTHIERVAEIWRRHFEEKKRCCHGKTRILINLDGERWNEPWMVDASTTVAELKQCCAYRLGDVDIHRLRLLFASEPLADDSTLSRLGIVGGSRLRVVISLF